MRLTGVAAAPGFAVGPAWRFRRRDAASSEARVALSGVDPDEISAVAEAQVLELADQLREAGRSEEAAHFDTQALIATDPVLLDEWRQRMGAGEDPLASLEAAFGAASWAVTTVADGVAAVSTTDVRDLGARMRRIVTGEDLDLPGAPSIIVAAGLAESVVAELPPSLVLGIALEEASTDAPGVSLARTLGIPCVVGVEGLMAALDRDAAATAGDAEASALAVAIDGRAGVVVTGRTADEVSAMHEPQAETTARDDVLHDVRGRHAQTRDGHVVRLFATIDGPADVGRAIAVGAAGIGIFRTEFLFAGRRAPAEEDEQVEAYGTVFEACGPDRPVTVRLANLGSDSDVPSLALPREGSPLLGLRAIRLAYRDRSLFNTQLRAISRAAAAAKVEPRVTAAMMSTLADVDLLNELVRDAQGSLAGDGLPRATRIVTGASIAVPSAVFLTRELAPRVDFFSVDADDLTQYLLAVDRSNAALADRLDPLHPAVLRAVRMVTGMATAAERPTIVSGGMAGDPVASGILVGLGVDDLSTDVESIEALRDYLAGVTHERLQRLSARSLDARDAAEVRLLYDALVDAPPPATN